jgi:hypothetical protein
MYRWVVGLDPLKAAGFNGLNNVNNKDDCLKLHHVGYLINKVMMLGTTNIKKH